MHQLEVVCLFAMRMYRSHARMRPPGAEIDAIGTKRFDSELSGDREVQRTMLELLNQESSCLLTTPPPPDPHIAIGNMPVGCCPTSSVTLRS